MEKPHTIILVILLLINNIPVQSQILNKDFGDENPYDIEIPQEILDLDPSAVVLFDKGRSYFSVDAINGFMPCFERHYCIKILRKEGFNFANHEIPLTQNLVKKEKLIALKANTYHKKGTELEKIKMSKNQVYEEETNSRKTTTKFAMPAIKEGSIIEVYYRISSPFLSQFKSWSFQSTIPIISTEFEASIPQYFFYGKMYQGYVPIQPEKQTFKNEVKTFTTKSRSGWYVSKTSYENNKLEYKTSINKWSAKNVEAFRQEPYMAGIGDYISKMRFEFQSFDIPGIISETHGTTWENINTDLLNDHSFGKIINRNKAHFNKIIGQLDLSGSSSNKLQKIHQFVTQQFTWNGSKTLFATKSLDKIIETKTGSNADLNLLFIGLVKEANIKAYPAVISTRDHGRITMSYPMIENLNYVFSLVEIDSTLYTIDVAMPKLKLGEIPYFCLNNLAWKVDESKYGWVNIKSTEGISTVLHGVFEIDEKGIAKGKLKRQKAGYAALWSREMIENDGMDKYIKNEIIGNQRYDIIASDIQNLNNPEQSLAESYELTLNYPGLKAGRIIFNPLLNWRIKENPFKNEDRKFPVNFGAQRREVFSMNFKIPSGYEVEQLPSKISVKIPEKNCSFKYNSGVNNGQIQVFCTLNIENAEFSPKEYNQLRTFYSQVIGKSSENIVLKKIDN